MSLTYLHFKLPFKSISVASEVINFKQQSVSPHLITMPLRYATPSDEAAIVSTCTAAFFNEALFGTLMHPYRHKYPNDVKIFWHEKIRQEWKTPSNKIIVATTTEAGKELVVGVAVWQRQGDDEGAKKVEKEWVDIGTFF